MAVVKYLKRPDSGVHCYDDHRVAMSFSVLATAVSEGALIQERECVGKTWPGWWDTLKQTFMIELEGEDLENVVSESAVGTRASVFLIGMRGAGKTTAGKWVAQILDRPFRDLDEYLEERTTIKLRDLKTKADWNQFRKEEIKMLKHLLQNEAEDRVFACGGGIVENEEARRLLTAYHKSGGVVISVERDIKNIFAFLDQDKSRPAYVAEHPTSVWDRRKGWYTQCSNCQFYSSR